MKALPSVPPVKRFDASGGFLHLPQGAVSVRLRAVEHPAGLVALLRAAGTLKLRLEAAGQPALWLGEAAPELPDLPAGRSPERYALAIAPGGVAAVAASEAGLLRAATTLSQALAAGEVPCGRVEDWPEREVRGVMLDVSRNRVYSLPTLFRVVDTLVQLKANRLELYFENVFAWRAQPGVWANTSPYTPGDLRALGAYCAERAVELVPNQNTLGHFERWFKAEPELLRLAECPEGGVRTPWGSVQETPTGLRAAHPETLAFLDGLLDALLPCFPQTPWANLGGDEVFDLGQGRSKAIAPPAELYFRHFAHLSATAARHGKRLELWADMLLRHRELLPLARDRLPAARWILWGYEASDPLATQAEALAAHGLDFLVAPGTSSWRSFCGRTENMLANLRAAAAIPSRGLLLTDWGDAGHWQPLAVSLPATVLAMSLAWDPAREPDLPAAVDALSGVRGLGSFLLRLGNTYRTAHAEAGNATKLFQAFTRAPGEVAFDPAALRATRAELATLAEEASALGDRLLAREARLALALQSLAVARASGDALTRRDYARVAAQLETLWLERGPRAQLDASLAEFWQAARGGGAVRGGGGGDLSSLPANG